MSGRAIQRGVRQSPRKMRLVADEIRGKNVNEAAAILKFSRKLAARQLAKTLRSAVANAQNKAQEEGQVLDLDDLVVREVFVNEGPTLKRWRAAAMGRAAPIRKRTSHITVVVEAKEA